MDLSCITISYSLAVQTYNGIFINGCCRHTVAADSAARDTVRVAPLRGSYAQIECGLVNVRVEELLALSKIFHVEIGAFFDGIELLDPSHTQPD